jgi:hypothetical protein
MTYHYDGKANIYYNMQKKKKENKKIGHARHHG